MEDKDRLISTLWLWNDALWAIVGGIMFLMIYTAIQKQQETTKETDRAAGNISVYIFWPDGINADIDLHMLDPEGDHVFFSKKSGKVWNLLRDDLGTFNDLTPRNFENAFARGLLPGEYVVNVQEYRYAGEGSVPVDAELRIEREVGGSRVTFNRHVVLDRTGDEATLFRFQIDSQGHFVPGSQNNLFMPLARDEK